MAPGAAGLGVYGPNDENGIADCINAAVDAGAGVISLSWGAAENRFGAGIGPTRQAIQRADSKGVNVWCASGDNLSGDGETGNHVDFAASCPEAWACGGTSIQADATEIVWNDGQGGGSGGGLSDLFAGGTYQPVIAINPTNRRIVPDVAGNADPASGWVVSVNGQMDVIGGTSMTAPMYAALDAILRQKLGRRITKAEVYRAAATFTDIQRGNNGAYAATIGFDACTGLGTVNGTKLLAALQGTAPAVPTPTPTPTPPPPPPTPTGPTVAQVRQALRQAYQQRLASIPPGWWHQIQTQIVASDARFTDGVLAKMDPVANEEPYADVP